MPGSLFVVATPIGNLGDFSPRGEETLRGVNLIACEDTRHTRHLLTHFGIRTPTISYHEHNEEVRSRELIRRLEAGESVALVSDAGTPLLSDPGYRLVRRCREQGIPVVPVPGPFAAAAAVSVSGLPTDQILFVGFLPGRPAAREKALKELAGTPATLVFYVPPHQLRQNLEAMLEVLGPRDAFLSRELTKLHEECISGTLPELLKWLGEREVLGEIALVVGGNTEPPSAAVGLDIGAYVLGLETARGLSPADAVRLAASQLGLVRKDVYNARLRLTE